LQAGTAVVGAQVTALKYKLSHTSFEHVASTHLELNEIGFCNLALDRAVPFDPYGENRDTGSFILIDRTSNATVAFGIIVLLCAAPQTFTGSLSRSTSVPVRC
jgi:bifunctional enzyme CysN/CysC